MEVSKTVPMSKWLLICLLCAHFKPCLPAIYENYQTLATDLFTNYSKQLRPVVDDSDPVIVYVAMWLSSIQELDEINQQLTFSALLDIYWEDPSLSWDPATYNNTHYMTYPQKDVWIPDLTIMNSVESMTEFGFDRNYLYLSHTGGVYWTVGGVYKTSCDIDVTYYPFDTQTCDVIFTTLVSNQFEIDLEFSTTESVSLEWYSKSGTWDLVSFTVQRVGDISDRTRVAFSITIKRLRMYYVVTVIVPVLFLCFTATLVFALPADSGEKMGTSITVLLAFAVYLTIVSDQMPRTSTQVSVLAVYLTLLLGQTAMGVLLSVWILNLHFRDDRHQPGQRLRRIVLFLRKLMCKGSKKTKEAKVQARQAIIVYGLRTEHVAGPSKNDAQLAQSVSPLELINMDNGVESKHTKDGKRLPTVSAFCEIPEMTWCTVAYVFDRFLFYSFSVLLLLLTVVCITILVVGAEQ